MKARIQDSTGGGPTDFDEGFRARLRDLLVWRRDVRRFRRDPLPSGTLERLIQTAADHVESVEHHPLPSGTLERLIQLACLAPSVGLSQPWRFVMVDDPGHRA